MKRWTSVSKARHFWLINASVLAVCRHQFRWMEQGWVILWTLTVHLLFIDAELWFSIITHLLCVKFDWYVLSLEVRKLKLGLLTLHKLWKCLWALLATLSYAWLPLKGSTAPEFWEYQQCCNYQIIRMVNGALCLWCVWCESEDGVGAWRHE